MASSGQAALRSAWLDAPGGQLSAWSLAKAWALRQVWKDSEKPEYGMLAHIAGKLQKAGGRNPTPQALGKLFAKMDSGAALCGRLQESIVAPADVGHHRRNELREEPPCN